MPDHSGELVERLKPMRGTLLIAESGDQIGVDEIIAALSRAEAEREEVVNAACDQRFDAGYQMAIEHCLRVCEIAKKDGVSIDGIMARIGLRAPDPAHLSSVGD